MSLVRCFVWCSPQISLLFEGLITDVTEYNEEIVEADDFEGDDDEEDIVLRLFLPNCFQNNHVLRKMNLTNSIRFWKTSILFFSESTRERFFLLFSVRKEGENRNGFLPLF